MSKWFKKFRYSLGAEVRLFGFPYAGGSATVFSDWVSLLPDNVDLLAVQAPGRGQRFNETPIGCLPTLVSLLHKEMLEYNDVPYVFIGHSNGSLLAYELARELQKSGNCNLAHMIISAKRAPTLKDIKEPIHQLTKVDFIERLRNYDFTPSEVLENDELMELFLPMLRADFSLSETLQFDASCLLDSDLTLMWGNQDVDVPYADILAWRELVTGETNIIEFTDSHFFINTQKELFVKHISKIVREKVLLGADKCLDF